MGIAKKPSKQWFSGAMSLKDDLLAAVWEQPHDDHPRLVYADWLEEQGDASRAEFIRLQCESALLEHYDARAVELKPKIDRLWKKHKKTWKAELPKGLQRFSFQRGFVAPPGKSHKLKSFLAIPPEFLAAAPTISVNLQCGPGDFSSIVCHPHMLRVGALHYYVFGNLPGAQNPAWAEGFWRNLRQLQLWSPSLNDATVDRISRHAWRFQNLRRVNFGNHSRCTDAIFKTLAESSLLENVTHFQMPRGEFTADGFSALLDSERLQRCKYMSVPVSRVADNTRYGFQAADDSDRNRDIMQRLAHSDGLPALERLNLHHNGTGAAVELLQRSPRFRLRELVIGVGTHDALPVLRALANWPDAQSLSALWLSGGNISEPEVKRLLESPNLASLTRVQLMDMTNYDLEQRRRIDSLLADRYGKRDKKGIWPHAFEP